MKKQKVFIFDVDGVLLDLWQDMQLAYSEFYKRQVSTEEWNMIIDDFLHDPSPYLEFGNYFDNSHWFGKLSPIEGMINLVNVLKDNGFDLAIVTSTNDDPNIIEERKNNICSLYGDVFTEIVFVGRAQSKEKALEKLANNYEVSYFCDDSIKNVVKARRIVTYPIWYENPHHLFMVNLFDVKDIISANGAKNLEEIVRETSNS